MNKLDALAYRFSATLSKAELRYLFEAKRLGKNSWREVFELLPEGFDPDDITVFENGDEIILITKSHIKDPADLMD